jgi:hypothetical protein
VELALALPRDVCGNVACEQGTNLIMRTTRLAFPMFSSWGTTLHHEFRLAAVT